MTLDTFFEKFELFADAPDAVAKMRDLVLQLAVQGRLADADESDEPVTKFLERIWSNKAGARSEITDAEKAQPFDIPPHWRWVVLAEVVEFSIGKTPPRGNSSFWSPEDHSWVSIADMKHFQTITETKEKVSSLAAKDVFRQRFVEPGSILMSFKLTIGKVARAGIKCFHNEAIISLKPPEQELSDFLFRFLPIFAALQTSNNAIKGNTLNKGLLTLLPIALPPLAEQKRIVAKVDALMGLCDRLEMQQQERETRRAALARATLARFADAPTPENLNFLFHSSFSIHPSDLRKSILTLAVQGKLVPQDPNDEPAEQTLYACGVDMKRWAVASGEKRHPVPDSWSWIRFAGVGEQRLGKMLDAQKNRGKLKPYLRNTNVQWMRFNLNDLKNMRVEEREEDELRLKCGDLLICEGGEPGRCAIWRDEIPEMYFQKAIHRVRPCSAVMSEFLTLNLQIDCRNDVLARYFTGATIKHLTGRSLAAYPVPIPPLAEQRRIVAKVDALMALVDALETQIATARTTVTALLEAAVAELTAKEKPNEAL